MVLKIQVIGPQNAGQDQWLICLCVIFLTKTTTWGCFNT